MKWMTRATSFWLTLYSVAQVKCPPNFQPQYLSLILMEMRIQHHFRNPQAISFPMVPDFAQIDYKKVKFEQFENFCLKTYFSTKFSPIVNLFCNVAMLKLNMIEQLTTSSDSKFNADSKTGIGIWNWASFVEVMKEKVKGEKFAWGWMMHLL